MRFCPADGVKAALAEQLRLRSSGSAERLARGLPCAGAIVPRRRQRPLRRQGTAATVWGGQGVEEERCPMSGRIHGSGSPAKVKFSPRRAARLEPTRTGLATHPAEDRHSVTFGETQPIRREIEILPIGQDTRHIRLQWPPVKPAYLVQAG